MFGENLIKFGVFQVILSVLGLDDKYYKNIKLL